MVCLLLRQPKLPSCLYGRRLAARPALYQTKPVKAESLCCPCFLCYYILIESRPNWTSANYLDLFMISCLLGPLDTMVMGTSSSRSMASI